MFVVAEGNLEDEPRDGREMLEMVMKMYERTSNRSTNLNKQEHNPQISDDHARHHKVEESRFHPRKH